MTNRTWLEQAINKPLAELIAYAASPTTENETKQCYEKLLDSIMAWHVAANGKTKNNQ